ncbi:MAG: hypothetical protein LBB83_12325 [Treponema sp.]|jgi:hypothetical protein|nr:hypothetical protein [Treponema sp.]
MMLLTSYKDTKNDEAKDIKKVGADTAGGMRSCYEETRKYAAEQEKSPPPENTRSNPADRIKRFREGISWKVQEDKEKILSSEMFKQSAILFIRCVLSPVYGETVSIDTYKTSDLNIERSYPGRKYFLASIIDALYDPAVEMDRNEIICIRRGQALIGLLSSAGPIPVTENRFSLSELSIDEKKDLKTIIRDLEIQDKRILMYWLTETGKNAEQNDLYGAVKSILEKEENVSDSDFNVIKQNLKIDKLPSGVPGFPLLREHGEDKLLERITLVPIRNNETRFGYHMPPLTIKSDDLFFVFLPPLTREAVESSRTGSFTIESITLVEPNIEAKKLVSITIRCVMEVNKLKIIHRNSYTNEQIRFIKGFPSLSLYGPAPKSGWIARRDIAPPAEYPSPLTGGGVETLGLKDIEFDGIDFEDTGDNYSVYCGEIPKWLGVRVNNGDWLGALPLRVVPERMLQDWEKNPVFIHTEPPGGTMTVAADIGSSRSVVLFRKDGASESKDNDIIIEEDQILGIPLTSSGDIGADATFGSMFFQPDKQHKAVQGKTPVGILTTNMFDKGNREDLLLYKSGKLILLDPKSISEASNRSIISDIKAGKNQSAMNLLTQGMLTMIVDRAQHLGCSKINIRLSYLKERYSNMNTAWTTARNKIEDLMPELRGKIDIKMYLPESLAIANRLRHDNDFQAVSGAALVDIGDFSTDIALYLKDFKESPDVKLKKNVSVLFAGRQILLQPIWDYLQFSKARVESVFAAANDDDKRAIKRLEVELEKQRREKTGNMPENVRRDLLCLMDKLKKEKIPPALQNLFDICYLTEVVILKRLLKNLPNDTGGSFDIHLFGGGSSLIKAKKDGFNWDAVLGRTCVTHPRSHEGNKLASGLLIDIQNDLQSAGEQARIDAENYEGNDRNRSASKIELNDEELKRGYIRFLKNAQALKRWTVMDSDDSKVNTGMLFNIKKPDRNLPGEIGDINLWKELYSGSMEFAMAGSTDDKEIIITLFAYKMAYSSAVAFYSKGRK